MTVSIRYLFREMRRVLADDGTLWLNLGDSYGGSTKYGRTDEGRDLGGGGNKVGSGNPGFQGKKKSDGLAKQLLGVPWRVAFALQADGWILRSDIVWVKPNPMPEPVTDRPTKSHEFVFLLAKSSRYYYNADAIREWDTTGHSAPGPRRQNGGGSPESLRGGYRGELMAPTEGRNKRDVWTVATRPFAAAHFAVYPPDLIRPCILAGSRPGDTVLDPFSGSGTTGMVATQEGRKYVGIDLNSEYLDLSLRERFAQPVLNFGGAL